MSQSGCLSRRQLISYLGAAGAGFILPSTALAGWAKAPEKELAFYNLHTGEAIATTFCSGDSYHQESLAQINRVLRDHRTDQVCDMDIELMELLFQLRRSLATDRPFHVISGYRSPATNRMLRQDSTGVAKKSLHMQGKAIDIRIPGIELKELHRAALALQGGGVGLYSRSDFVHLDVGRVRRWGV